MDACVFCKTTSNLNTKMTLKLDTGSVEVFICDEHADDATPKSAKAAYLQKQGEADALLKQLRELGYDVAIQPSGLTVAKGPPPLPSKPQPQSVQEAKVPQANYITDDMLDLEKVPARPMVSRGGSSDGHTIESHQSLDTSEFSGLKKGGKVRMVEAQGRAGQPLIVPQTIVDQSGVTTITIKQRANDGTIQKRMKDLNNVEVGTKGYILKTVACPLCQGRPWRPTKDHPVCPKCGGAGEIEVS